MAYTYPLSSCRLLALWSLRGQDDLHTASRLFSAFFMLSVSLYNIVPVYPSLLYSLCLLSKSMVDPTRTTLPLWMYALISAWVVFLSLKIEGRKSIGCQSGPLTVLELTPRHSFFSLKRRWVGVTKITYLRELQWSLWSTSRTSLLD